MTNISVQSFSDLATNTNIFIGILVIIVLLILFSPLTYLIFEKLFRSIRKIFVNKTTEEAKHYVIQEIQSSVESLISVEKGATIVIDIRNETNEYVIDSELLDSRITSNLLINIFEGSKTPLHDGAIIIKNNRIDRASAMITKLSEQEVPKKFGTRHRSALGLSEVTKAIIIVVSEETGKVTIFHKGKWEEVKLKELAGTIVNLWD